MEDHCDYCDKELSNSEELELGVCLTCQQSYSDWDDIEQEIKHILTSTIPMY